MIKIKILAFGDIHGDSVQARKLALKAEKENVDLVVICGDITHFDASIENIIGQFKQKKMKVLLVPGNHESLATADFLAEFYDVKNLHGYSVKYDNLGIFGAGGANVGPNIQTESEIFNNLKYAFEKIKLMDKKIMVTHVHPSNTMMEKFSKFVPGSTGVKKAVESFQPDILLCSHVHEAEGLEEKMGKTRVINVGKEGKIIEL